MAFIGVSTTRSSIVPIFPRWAAELGLDGARLTGHDVPLRADRHVYRELVGRLIADPAVRGALVTSHKVEVFDAAGDLFDELDPLAAACGEISCFARRSDGVAALALDPITVSRALPDVAAPDHFARTGGHLLCLGAGGSGTALAVHLMCDVEPAARPSRVILADRDTARLEKVRRLLRRLEASGDAVELVHAPIAARLVEELPPHSLIVNATGMGKDVPGSPLDDGCRLPQGAIAWDFNYRGDLRFLAQAAAQADRGVRAVDGWNYFLHGWSEHMARVYGFDVTPQRFARLRSLAAEFHP
jgi:shikimate 5-dehydrogenase